MLFVAKEKHAFKKKSLNSNEMVQNYWKNKEETSIQK